MSFRIWILFSSSFFLILFLFMLVFSTWIPPLFLCHNHLLYLIPLPPSLTKPVPADSSQMAEICADKATWFILSDSPPESQLRSMLLYRLNKLGCHCFPPSLSLKLIYLIVFLWDSDEHPDCALGFRCIRHFHDSMGRGNESSRSDMLVSGREYKCFSVCLQAGGV